MAKRVKASDLYKAGRFNTAEINANPDGSTTITCQGGQAPAPYKFRARDLLTDREEILEEDELQLEDEAEGGS
jgi:hypothetical protein